MPNKTEKAEKTSKAEKTEKPEPPEDSDDSDLFTMLQPVEDERFQKIRAEWLARQKREREERENAKKSDQKESPDLDDLDLHLIRELNGEPDILHDLSKTPPALVIFRDGVINQMISILIGKSKPNALLIGPAGAGKTAVVEELAHRIADDTDPTIPPQLADTTIYSLQISDIVAGCNLVGMLEDKVKEVIAYLEDPENNAILFLDEIHQLLTAGNPSYQKIAQILKPVLSRGRIRVIGSTTSQEVKDLEADPAFNRRFTRVLVDELTVAQTVEVLIHSAPAMGAHYDVSFTLDKKTAELIVSIADEFCSVGSHRPDNAVTLFDRCFADAVLKKHLQRVDPDPAVRAKAEASPNIVLTEEMIRTTAVKLITGNNEPLPFSEKRFRADFARIRGQDAVLEPLLRMMKRHTAHLRPQKKPLTLLFMGPSGTGKTEVTKLLAKNYLAEKPIILNMTEYTENHTVSRIIGSPPGYIGYSDNNERPFDMLDTNPYQVILLDEFEKCHPSVQRLFMSVFDEGVLKTNRGKTIDFSKSIIIATTNAGCTNDARTPVGFGAGQPSARQSDDQLVDTLKKYFNIELLNRFTKRYRFDEIRRETFIEILKDCYLTQTAEIRTLRPSAPLPDILSDADADALADRYYNPLFGARPANDAVAEYIDDLLIP